MLKRILAVIMLSYLLPVMAYAANWPLSTWVKSGGGDIVVRDGAPQTSVNGSVFKTYTTSLSFAVTVNPNIGYSISQVTYNGVVTKNPVQTSYTVQGPNSQNVYATFLPKLLTVTASAGEGGSVSPASLNGINYGTKLTVVKKFTFRPGPSTFSVASINGVPAGATVNPAVPAAANTPVTVTLPVGFTFTSNIALVGTFSGPPVAKAGTSQTVTPGAPVTLDGSTSSGSPESYSWNQISGPGFPAIKVIADNTSGVQTTFIPTVVGTYIFSLTVTGGSTANITVTVTNDLVGAIRTACYNCHAASGIGTSQNVFGKWSSSSHKSKGVVCSKCHVGADTGGHPGQVGSGSVSEINFNYTGATGSSNFCVTCHNPAIVTDFAASKHFIRAGSASCSYCHVGGVHNPNAACIDCHNPGNSQGLPWPPAGLEFHNTYTGTNRCTECHNQHSVVASGCDGCHGAPPATASHLKHFGGSVSQAGYGDLRIAQDFTANSTGYIIGCGNCHPMDMTKHRNGVVDIELYNPQATAGSLKARNPASAGYVTGPQIITDNKGIPYTEGTCSNVYCHSYNDWTTTAAIPADDPNWQDKVVVTRKYKSATWGGAALGCSGCHGNPTQTSYPTNDGGAGDSHAWIDSYGYGNLHTFNMAADPVSCSYCHNDTVTQKNTFTRNNMDVTVLGDVPITNFSKHVNGNNDVAFDTQKQFVYYSSSSHVSMSLAGATYVPATKTCSNVSCHQQETTVKWGTPYRIYYDACDKCHGYGGY